MKKNILLVLFIVFIGNSSVFAKTDQFFLEYGANMPPTFLGLESKRKVSQVFINPAGIYQNKNHSVKLEYSQALFGYSFLSFAYVLPLKDFALGFGYQNFSSNDIPQTAIVQTDARPEIIGYMLDQQSKFDLNAAYAFTNNFYGGVGLHLYTENLASTTISQGIYSDVGLYYRILDNLEIGASYRIPLRAFQKALSLSNKYTEIPYTWNLEAFYKLWLFQAGFLYQSVNRIGFLEFYLTDGFSLVGEHTWDKNWQAQSLGLGTILDLNFISLQYFYVIMFKEGIELSQSIFSVKFDF
ncbi:MAG: hypothetical protein WC860_00760 [Candidatus Margulisiibacteriota bacterium]|jgi:hypothetical protein